MTYFYHGRLPAHVWGKCDENATESWRPQPPSNFYETVFFGTNGTSPIVPYEAVPRIVQRSNPSNSIAYEDVPCTHQLPWKKLQHCVSYFIGLTIHGELYLWGEGNPLSIGSYYLFDIHGSLFGQQAARQPRAPLVYKPMRDRDDFYRAAGYTARPWRIRLAGVEEPIKDFSSRLDTLTVITKSGRVFVAGNTLFGSHGAPDKTPRADGTLVGFLFDDDSNGPSMTFVRRHYAPTTFPYFPVTTEVHLPENVAAAACPHSSSHCVIGSDGQLYWWVYDIEEKTMYEPKPYTGFVKKIEIDDGGSGYTLGNNTTSFSAPLKVSPAPPGGRDAAANVYVKDGVAQYVWVYDPGYGYASPPTIALEKTFGGITLPGGSGATFSAKLFDDSHSFATDSSCGGGYLLGSDGDLYVYSALYGSLGKYEQLSQLEFRVAWHSSGPYSFARENVVVRQSDGQLFVSLNTEGHLQGVSLDVEGVIVSDNFPTFGNASQPMRYKTNALYPVPGAAGFECGACRALAASHGNCLLAIKSDGTLWSAGGNRFGSRGDSDDTSDGNVRSTLAQIAGDSRWTDAYTMPTLDQIGTICAAIRKDGRCTHRNQEMVFYPDSYFECERET